jgi:hypothetical protein
MILIGIIIGLTGTDYNTAVGILFFIGVICIILGMKSASKLGKGTQLDKDGDGKISDIEWADLDGDGNISADEEELLTDEEN